MLEKMRFAHKKMKKLIIETICIFIIGLNITWIIWGIIMNLYSEILEKPIKELLKELK